MAALSLDVAKELALGETSVSRVRAEADWDDRGGDIVNAEAAASWRARPIDEVRQEFARVAGELRGYLTVVPETRWLKNAEQQRFFYEETIEHYEDHEADLKAILEAAGSDDRRDRRGHDRRARLRPDLGRNPRHLGRGPRGRGGRHRWRGHDVVDGGRPFATLAGEWAEFRLDPMVARAALRTADTSHSMRGPDWVVFAPSTMDDPAIDRAEAWFLSAHRLAAGTRH